MNQLLPDSSDDPPLTKFKNVLLCVHNIYRVPVVVSTEFCFMPIIIGIRPLCAMQGNALDGFHNKRRRETNFLCMEHY